MAFSPRPTQARRRFLLAVAGLSALAVAGCQMGGRGPFPGPIGPGGIELPAQHLVAVIVPLTGDDAGIGQSITNAANLALFDTGEKSLRLTAYDSAGPGGAAGAAERALADGAGLILGPLLAADVRAAAPVTRRAGVPLIAFSNDESVAGKGVFIIGFTPDQSIARTVRLARDRGMTKFAAMVPSGIYGERAGQAMLDAVRASGGHMAGMEIFERSAASTKAAAARLRATGGIDAILIADSGRIAALAAPSLPRAAKLIGTELWASDGALGKTAALRGAWYAAAPDERFNQLVTRYKARYGKTPYRLGSLGYDAVLLAARSAKAWPVGRPFPLRTLQDRDGFAGVDGTFRFGAGGVAERLLEVRQVTASGTTVIAPAATAF